jgi:hypothetical protein
MPSEAKAKVAVSFALVVFSLMIAGTPDANAGSKLPGPTNAGVAGPDARSFLGA